MLRDNRRLWQQIARLSIVFQDHQNFCQRSKRYLLHLDLWRL